MCHSVFDNSVYTHWIIGMLITIVLLSLSPVSPGVGTQESAAVNREGRFYWRLHVENVLHP